MREAENLKPQKEGREMAAIWRGCKQYFVTCESDRKICGGYEYTVGYASTIKSAKAIIRNERLNRAEFNPRNFKVYDSYAEVDKSTNHVPCVYTEV